MERLLHIDLATFLPMLDQRGGGLDVLDADHRLAADLQAVHDHIPVAGAGRGECVSVGVAGSVFCGHGKYSSIMVHCDP